MENLLNYCLYAIHWVNLQILGLQILGRKRPRVKLLLKCYVYFLKHVLVSKQPLTSALLYQCCKSLMCDLLKHLFQSQLCNLGRGSWGQGVSLTLRSHNAGTFWKRWKCDGSKIWASVHTMPEQFENGRKLDGKKLAARLWCQRNVPTPWESISVVPKASKNVVFYHFQVFTRCCFQNVLVRVPFSKSTGFKICQQKMCRFLVNGRPIRRLFHRFQNVPASC